MRPSVTALLAAIRSGLRTRAELAAEIVALRHQLAVLQQAAPRRLGFSRADRLLWVLLSRVWSGWRGAVQIVQPATVVAWHRRWRSARPRLGSPSDRNRRPRADPHDASRQSLVGCAPHSRRTPEVG